MKLPLPALEPFHQVVEPSGQHAQPTRGFLGFHGLLALHECEEAFARTAVTLPRLALHPFPASQAFNRFILWKAADPDNRYRPPLRNP